MADPTPTNDPLGDRLRSTFEAERTDLARRTAPLSTTASQKRTSWLPMAMAAALIALAGFAFAATRSDDTAVDLGVAGKPSDPSPTAATDSDDPDNDVSEDEGQDATVQTDADAAAITCAASRAGAPIFVMPAAADAAQVVLRSTPDMSGAITQTLASNVIKPLTSNCDRSADGRLWSEVIPGGWIPDDLLAATSPACLADGSVGSLEREGATVAATEGTIQGWAFLDGDSAAFASPVWDTYRWFDPALVDLSADCITSVEAIPPDEGEVTGPRVAGANANQCDQTLDTTVPHFIWGILLDDPDGGLVAHTTPMLSGPVTRVVPLDGLVFLAGGCVDSPDLIRWIQVVGPTQLEWVSNRFIQAAEPACLIGEQFGTRTRSGKAFVHVVEAGDTLGSIASRYDMTLDALLEANHDLDPTALKVGDFLLVDSSLGDADQIFGPLDGHAILDVDRVAFAANGASAYRWYPAEAVRIGESCTSEGPVGPVCLRGDVRLIDPQSPEPIWTSSGPVEAQRTGRLIGPLQPRATYQLVEVVIELGDNQFRTGIIDPTTTEITAGPCEAPSIADDLATWPCAANDSIAPSSSGTAGSSDSVADHVHNIRVEDTDPCVRIVIELGTGRDTSADTAASLVPSIAVTKDPSSTEVRFAECDPTQDCVPFGNGSGEPSRVDFRGGTVFIAVDGTRQPYVQVVHDLGRSAVTLLSDPARIVVDWQPRSTSLGVAPLPLEKVILLRNIDDPASGPAIEPPTARVVRGFARPFEAQGIWHVFTIDDEGVVSDTPTSVASGPLRTAGWVDGWGEFVITLPDLPEGDYAVVFGESPVDGNSASFVGSGQRIRVSADPDATWASWATNPYIDYLEVNVPILVLD